MSVPIHKYSKQDLDKMQERIDALGENYLDIGDVFRALTKGKEGVEVIFD